jgi:hypothetical protein
VLRAATASQYETSGAFVPVARSQPSRTLAELRYVDSGRADAGRLPVNERGDLVAGPEEVAGPDVAMDEDGFAER